jgi:hypothetical protein
MGNRQPGMIDPPVTVKKQIDIQRPGSVFETATTAETPLDLLHPAQQTQRWQFRTQPKHRIGELRLLQIAEGRIDQDRRTLDQLQIVLAHKKKTQTLKTANRIAEVAADSQPDFDTPGGSLLRVPGRKSSGTHRTKSRSDPTA